MRIAFVSEYYPPHTRGGAEISTSILVSELKKKYDCFLITQRNLGEFNESYVFDILHEISNDFSSLFKIFRFFLLDNTINPIINIFLLIKFSINKKINLINIIGTSYLITPLIMAGIILRKPIVLDVRSGGLLCPTDYSRGSCLNKNLIDHHCFSSLNIKTGYWDGRQELLRLPFALIKYSFFIFYRNLFGILAKYKKLKIVAISNYIKDELVTFGIDPSKIIVINNMSEESPDLTDRQRQGVLTYAGRLEPSKGILQLLNAFTSAESTFQLQIIGDGSLTRLVQRYAKYNMNIHYLGKLRHSEVLKKYSSSFAIIAPSIWPEPYGRFIQDSYSTRTPLITTHVGGIPEGITNLETGIIIKPDSALEIKKALYILKENRILYKSIQNNLEKNSWKFKSEFIVPQRIDLYDSLLLESYL